ncbi:MAG: hypothetical protein WCJ92_08105 [Alphaproteobacteria bacterium]
MRFISFIYLTAVFLILIILVMGQDFYSSYQTLYCACFLTSLPFYVLPILSAMYLFDKHHPSRHILIGTSIIFALFSSRILFRMFMNAVSFEYLKFSCVFTALITCLSLLIYAYVEKNTVQASPHSKTIKKSALSFVQKLNCTFIGTGWNLGFSYFIYYLAPYMKNIYVIDHYTIGGTSICLIAQMFGLFLAIPVYKKLGTLNTLTVSLCCMLVLGISIPFIGLSKNFFSLLLCVLGFLSACCFVPILTILHQYYKSSKSLTLCWFTLGAAISTLLFGIVLYFTNSCEFKFGGVYVFIVCVALSLIGVKATQPRKITEDCTKLAA